MENKIRNIVRFYILMFSLKNDYITLHYVEEKFKTLVSYKDIDYEKLYRVMSASATNYIGDMVKLIEKFVDIEDVHDDDVSNCLHEILEEYVDMVLETKVNNRYYITRSIV